MSMRFKIFQSVPYTDSKGVTYRNHKVFIKNKPYWISEKDFIYHPELLKIHNENIVLKEPLDSFYSSEERNTTKGQIFSLIPTEFLNKEMLKDDKIKSLSIEKDIVVNTNAASVGDMVKINYKGWKIHILVNETYYEELFKFGTPGTVIETSISPNSELYKKLEETYEDVIFSMKDMYESEASDFHEMTSEKPLYVDPIIEDEDSSDLPSISKEDLISTDELFNQSINEPLIKPQISLKQKKVVSDIVDNQQKSSLDAKIQFINGLVAMASREKINNRLRERLFNLVSKELDGQKGREDKIFEEINNIKKILLQSQTVPPPTSDTGDLPEYISPNDLYKFLLEYNTDPILKYTCHEIQDESVIDTIVALSQNTKYKYTDHLAIIRNAYKSLTKKHKVNKRIWSLMNNYINGPNEWSSDNIPINWSSPEIIEWSFNNPEKVPNPGGTLVHKTKNKGFTFSKPIYSGLTGEKITSFSQLIIHFKHMFHLKGDHSLRTVIEKINNTESFKEHIDFKFSETHFWNNLELFTDVDKLKQAYKDILKMILEFSKINKGDKPVVGLEFYEENSRIYFSIHHINSVYQKTLTNTIERIGESQSNLIKTKINGLCDLFLKADFGHDIFALVNLWDGNERTSISIPEFMGVQYILKF